MKTEKELNSLKNDIKKLNEQLAELSEEELKQVTGGFVNWSSSDGETSTVISGDHPTWLREAGADSDKPTSAWYGLENPVKK